MQRETALQRVSHDFCAKIVVDIVLLTIRRSTDGIIGITKAQWEAVNDYHDYPVMLDQDHGTGSYLASLEGFHQLHCVVRFQLCFPRCSTLHSQTYLAGPPP